jgi:predicted DNA-binding transcriptional regulator AlpA
MPRATTAKQNRAGWHEKSKDLGEVAVPKAERADSAFASIQLIRKRPLARLLGVNSWTVDRWRKKGTFPRPIWLSPTTPVWKLSDVEKWLDERKG